MGDGISSRFRCPRTGASHLPWHRGEERSPVSEPWRMGTRGSCGCGDRVLDGALDQFMEEAGKRYSDLSLSWPLFF